jgi:hypothetical protein
MKIRKDGKVINLTETDLRRIVKRVISEQSTDAKSLENVLISKFIEGGNAGKEYSDPGMKTEFFNDYEIEYKEWLTKNGFKGSDIMLDQDVDKNRLAEIEALIKKKGWKL